MRKEQSIDPICHTCQVSIDSKRAFALFTEGLARWWPPEFTWSADGLETIAMEPGVDGHCYEIGPYGFRSDWGRVLVWQPPRAVRFTWQISPRREPQPDPAKASEVQVRFIAERPSTARVEFTHSEFARHGDGAADYRAALASPQGWPYILERYRAAAEAAGSND